MSKQNDANADVRTNGEAFMAALANALWDIHKSRRISRSIGAVLARFGIEVPEDTATNAEAPEFKLPSMVPADDEYIGHGVDFKDLSDEAKAKKIAEKVKAHRQDAYEYLRSQCEDYGRYNVAEVTRHFGKLGFPMPDTQTTISAEVRQGETWKLVTTTVPGTVTEDEARQALEPLASHSEAHNMAQQAFPQGDHTESLLRVYLNTESVWKPLDA